jgi:hypothetical protein
MRMREMKIANHAEVHPPRSCFSGHLASGLFGLARARGAGKELPGGQVHQVHLGLKRKRQVSALRSAVICIG